MAERKRNGTGAVFIGVAAVILVFLATPSFLRAPEVPDATEPVLVLPDGEILTVELARTRLAHIRGLSRRESLGEAHGMLFEYAHPTVPSFWMKDMNFSIDIIWLYEGRIVGIEPSVAPETFPKTFSPPEAVTHVLEVNAGLAERHGLMPGDFLELRRP